MTKTKEDRAFGLLNRTYDLLVHGRDETGEACDLFDRVKLCNDIGDLLKRDEVFWVRRAARFSNEGFDIEKGKEIVKRLDIPKPPLVAPIAHETMQETLERSSGNKISDLEVHEDHITYVEHMLTSQSERTITGEDYQKMLHPLMVMDPGEIYNDVSGWMERAHKDIAKTAGIPAEYLNAPDCRSGQIIHGSSPSAAEGFISENYELLQQKLEEYYEASIANILIRCNEVCFTICGAGRHCLTIAEAKLLCQ